MLLALLKKILGKEDKFYQLLEASAKQAQKSAQLLANLHANIGAAEFQNTLSELHQSRREDKRIAQNITHQLCQTFITPFEREDIEALANALYKIPKTAEKIGERISFYPSLFSTETVGKQIQLLIKATDVVVTMVHQLRKISDVEKIKSTYDALQLVEGEADKFINGNIRGLYQNDTVRGKEMLILCDVYEQLEKATDLCRDAGKIVFQVALKYS